MNFKNEFEQIKDEIEKTNKAQYHTLLIRDQLKKDPELLAIKDDDLRKKIATSIIYLTYDNEICLPIHTESYILLLIEYFFKIFGYLDNNVKDNLEKILYGEIYIIKGFCKILKKFKLKKTDLLIDKNKIIKTTKNQFQTTKNEIQIYNLLKLWVKIPKKEFHSISGEKILLDANYITHMLRNDIRNFYVLFIGTLLPITSIGEGILFLEKVGLKKIPPKEKSIFFDTTVILDIVIEIFTDL